MNPAAHCPFCHQNACPAFQAKDYNRRVSRVTFHYYRCPGCGVVFLDPVPNNLDLYYPKNYYARPSSENDLAKVAHHDLYKVDIVRQFKAKGRLLEIGAAFGVFAWLAKKDGFEVEVVEMDSDCCRFLTDVVGIPAINSHDIPGTLLKTEAYDIIALWHVLEHLPDPAETLQALSRSLTPGGILVMALPNPEAWQFRILRKYWPHVDAPRHLRLIPASTIIKKLEPLGLTKVLLTTRDRGSLYWNVFAWEHFFGNLCRVPGIHHGLRLIGRVLGIVLSLWEKGEGRGSAYTIVFRKDSAT